MKDSIHHILSASGDKVSAGVAGGTMVAGAYSYLAQIQSWLSVIAVGAGAILSFVLIAKALLEMKYAKEKRDRENDTK